MIDALYTKPLLRLASDAAGAGRLSSFDAEAETRSPICGDRIAVTVRLDGKRISELGHETTACVLCQASASLLAQVAPGLDAAEIETGRHAIAEMLASKSARPSAPAFQRFAIFSALGDHAARHQCVLLPFQALLKALAACTM
jgi:nitrogen fixation NifU-like protein